MKIMMINDDDDKDDNGDKDDIYAPKEIRQTKRGNKGENRGNT